MGEKFFGLDSICPTGAGKVAGVKIEIDGERWVGGVKVPRECKMQSGECRPAINGISRETAQKAQNSRNFEMGRWQDRRFEAGFSEGSPTWKLAFVFRAGGGLMGGSMKKRQATIRRVTRETKITVTLNLDGAGKASVRTGVPFLDHMLTLFAKHAVLDLKLRCQGDLEVDAHHTVEDCGLALGQAFLQALGEKKGLRRYGTGFDPRNPLTGEAYVPMDECLARCVVDFGGRPHLVWRGMAGAAHKKITPRGEDAGCLVRFPVWPGPGVFPGLRQRSPLQSALGIALRRGTAPHRGGALQGVCPCGRCCLSTGSANCRTASQHQRESCEIG